MAKEFQPVLALAARTATTSATFSTRCESGLFFINVTSITATPSITVTVEGLDPYSNTAYTIIASAAISTVSLTVLRVNPRLAAVANQVVKTMLPEAIKVTVAHADTDSITYSVSFIGVE